MADFIKSSADFLADFQPPDYLLDGVLQRRFCYSLTARTGVGKTAVAMLLAAHVATGRPLGGLYVAKGSVLYLAGENPTDVQMRWLGLTQEMSLDPEQMDVHFIPGVVRLSESAEAISREIRDKKLELALVIVDTVAAFFEGDNDNDNVQAGVQARALRSMTCLPGGPSVLLLAHPTKRAADDDLIPRGGGAFLNEVDGNIALQKRESLIAASVQGKFRGPEFTPMYFELKAVRHPRLKDTRGRDIPTVIAQSVDEAGKAVLDAAGQRDEDKLLHMLEKHPRASMRTLSMFCGWRSHSKVERLLKTLKEQKLVKKEGRAWVLTAAGQKELNNQEYQQDKPVLPHGTVPPPSNIPLPPLPRH